MENNNILLTFENENNNQLHIHMDKKGLNCLIEILTKLRVNSENDHIHLMTPEYGGTDLSENRQSENAKLINIVTMHLWK